MKPFINKPTVFLLSVAMLIVTLSRVPNTEAATLESFSDEGTSVSYLFNLFTQSLTQDIRPTTIKKKPSPVDSSPKDQGLAGVDRVHPPQLLSVGKTVFLSSEAAVFHDFLADRGALLPPGSHLESAYSLPAAKGFSTALSDPASGTSLVGSYSGLPTGAHGMDQSIKQVIAQTLDLPKEGRVFSASTPKGTSPTNRNNRLPLGDMDFSEGIGTRYGYSMVDGSSLWGKLLGNSDRTQIWPENSTPGAKRHNTMLLVGTGLAGALMWRMKKAQA